MDRNVVVVSGLPYSGKSWYLKRLLELPEFEEAVSIRMDDARVALYGDRADTHVTRSEHLFKNEKTRNTILEKLVLGNSLLVTEVMMPTEEGHQRPFVEMIHRANDYVQAIEREYAVRDQEPMPNPASKVFLKVILFHSSLEVIRRRVADSSEERRLSNAGFFDFEGMRGAATIFTFPRIYEPLILDTSDESQVTHASRTREIIDFVFNGSLPYNQAECQQIAEEHLQEVRHALRIT